ncbi:sialic acid-binding Ig-like lectin 5 isoform X7 [Prionailurus viverrinus]|uniref:sialic acid-binding Ig-like lectin 5 isoform X7 n=1 Tax=Prionailurus viverrinus TaxID=61388 RepID=UPI001FF0EF1F|nr:sialic acid-binding Ig-like lectin 5 isoform X7 [Prionailurus viverrinus]
MVPLLLLPLLLGGEDPEYQLRVKESVTVQEGLCVHVPCSFSYPWNLWYSQTMLYIYWFREKDTSSNRYPVATNNPQRTVRTEARGRFCLVGDPWANNCSLRIRDAMRSDEGVYFFRVERENVRYTYTHTTMTLRVAALTQEPDIHFPEPLKSGWPAELTCSLPGSCEGGRPLTFSWVGAALDSLDPETLHSSVVTFTPRPQDHGTKLTCQVKLPEVQATVERTIWLNVSYAPHNLTISIFSNVTASSILFPAEFRVHQLRPPNSPGVSQWGHRAFSEDVKPGHLSPPHSGKHLIPSHLGGPSFAAALCCCQQPPRRAELVPGVPCPECHPHVQDPHPGAASSRGCGGRNAHLPCSELAGLPARLPASLCGFSEGPWANSSLSLRGPLRSDLRLGCEARNEHGTQSTDAVLVLLPGKSLSLAETATAAVGGAGAMALLCLCLCLLVFWVVKARRKQASRSQEGMANEDPVMGTVDWGSRKKPWPDSPPDQTTPAGDAPPSGEQQELHYASFSFHGIKMREPQDQEATSTSEYSEIRRSK